MMVQITGITPLLLHRFTDAAALSVENGAAGRAVMTGKKPLPREAADEAAYKLPNGELYLPAQNLFSAIVDAGSFHKVGKRQLTTARSSLIPAGVAIDEMELPFGTKEFEVDSRRVCNPHNNSAVICHRARLDTWQCSFTLDIDETMFDPALVRELLDTAGKKIGIGAFRPRRRGPFGRFVVTKWEEIRVPLKKIG
jgi:hypothetical protein